MAPREADSPDHKQFFSDGLVSLKSATYNDPATLDRAPSVGAGRAALRVWCIVYKPVLAGSLRSFSKQIR